MKSKFLFALLVGAAAVLGGCATPNAGGVAHGITIIINATEFSGPGPTEAFVKIEGDSNGGATAAPETSGQTASTSTSPSVSVPASVVPGQ